MNWGRGWKFVDCLTEIPCIDILDMSVVIKSIVVHLKRYWSRLEKTNIVQEFEIRVSAQRQLLMSDDSKRSL